MSLQKNKISTKYAYKQTLFVKCIPANLIRKKKIVLVPFSSKMD